MPGELPSPPILQEHPGVLCQHGAANPGSVDRRRHLRSSQYEHRRLMSGDQFVRLSALGAAHRNYIRREIMTMGTIMHKKGRVLLLGATTFALAISTVAMPRMAGAVVLEE